MPSDRFGNYVTGDPGYGLIINQDGTQPAQRNTLYFGDGSLVAADDPTNNATQLRVGTGTVLTSTGTLAFSGLNGDAVNTYRLWFFAKCSTASSYMIRINGDAGSNYRQLLQGGSIATPTVLAGLSFSAAAGINLNNQLANSGYCSGSVDIVQPRSGIERTMVGNTYSHDTGAGSWINQTFGAEWTNTANAITSIGFVFSGTLTNFFATLTTL